MAHRAISDAPPPPTAIQKPIVVNRDDIGWLIEMAMLIKIPGAKPTPRMVEAYNRLRAAIFAYDKERR